MKPFRIFLTGLLLWGLPSAAFSCEVCFGDADDPQTKGMQGAIITLLIVTYLTITGLVGMFIFQLRRARLRGQQTPIEP